MPNVRKKLKYRDSVKKLKFKAGRKSMMIEAMLKKRIKYYLKGKKEESNKNQRIQ